MSEVVAVAGPGRAPKANALNRRTPRGGQVDAPPAEAPSWPLGENIAMRAERDSLAEELASVQQDMEDTDDAKRRGSLRRREQALKSRLVRLEAQMRVVGEVEAAIWAEMWALPQASSWLALGWLRDIAQYVRHKAMAEMGSMDDAKEARQWSDRLGLSPRAAMQLGLDVRAGGPPASATQRAAEKAAGVVSMDDRRKRLQG